jgi:hypothetical protein
MSYPRASLTFVLACAALLAGASTASATRHLPVLRIVPKPAHGAVTRTIGTHGGTIRVKAARGTTATLLIPAGALQTNAQITMTPLAAVKRVPFKRGVVGAVRLAPEGLTLIKPGKLTFQSKKQVPLARQTPFSASGRGASFHIYPGKGGRRQLSLPLFHFSIYGEGDASPAERAQEARRAQSGPQSAAERDLAMRTSPQATAERLYPYMDYVAELDKTAATDDAYAADAIAQTLSLAEELRYVGWSSEVLPEIGNDIPKSIDPALRARIEDRLNQIKSYFPDKILRNALQQASYRCSAYHQPAQADRILSIEEQLALFRVTDEVDLEPVQKCLTFELDIDTDFQSSDNGSTEVHAQTKIPLHVSPALSFWSGSGPVTYLKISDGPTGPCSYTATGSGSWDVFGLGLTLGKIDSSGGEVSPTQLQSVSVLAPNTEEDSTVTCPSGSSQGRSAILNVQWSAAHADELSNGLNKIQNWSSGSGDVLGTKSYSRTYQNGGRTWSETTTLQLRHTPGA